MNSILQAHNSYRAIHGVSPLSLDQGALNQATKWANYLAQNNLFDHSTGSGYGENLFKSWGASYTEQQVTESWYSEIKDYNWANPGFSGATGHFTQVVWKSSTGLGCGRAGNSQNGEVTVCNYSPPGNYLGQFAQNVLPPNQNPVPIPLPSPVAVPGPILKQPGYIGCFIDGPTRAMGNNQILSSTLTVSQCKSYCSNKQFMYAGLENGNECYCSNDMTTNNSGSGGFGGTIWNKVTQEQCSATCQGDSSNTCGGPWLLDVYSSGYAPTPTTYCWKCESGYSLYSSVSPQSISSGYSLKRELGSTGRIYSLQMKTTGKLSLVDTNSISPVWVSAYSGLKGTYTATLQSDGNFVIYSKNMVSRWSTGTFGKGSGPYCLTLQNDRNLVLYDSQCSATWATNTNI